MKSFWWFKEKSIAGLGRPGFNAVHWFDLPFDEAVFLGWLGQYSSGRESLQAFRKHLDSYAPRIFKFYGLNEKTGPQALEVFGDSDGTLKVIEKLVERTGILEDYGVVDEHLQFTLNRSRLDYEVDFLKGKGVHRIVSLTEHHHQRDVLGEHFDLHHISIQDLSAPTREQAHHLSEILTSALKNRETIAVHCLAGIGRTSTMLMAAHILMGENANELEALLKRQNPTFILTGPQGEFLRSLRA